MKNLTTQTLGVAAIAVLIGCGDDPTQADPDKLPEEQANIFFSECSPNPCENGGSCADTLFGYQCTCVGSFTGDHCETAPASSLPPIFNQPPPDAGAPPANPPPATPPSLFPFPFDLGALFPSDHKLTIEVPQTVLNTVLSAPTDLKAVTTKLNGQACTPGACSVTVGAFASATVEVTVDLNPKFGPQLPVLRSFDNCAATASSFTYDIHEDQSVSASWTYTFSGLTADETCTANFARAGQLWFHLPAAGPSVAQVTPAAYCDYVVNPISAAQLPAGTGDSWSTLCLFPPGTTAELTPIYQGRTLSEMECSLQSPVGTLGVQTKYTSTPVTLSGIQAGQGYECGAAAPP